MFIPSSYRLNGNFLETTFTDLNLFDIAAAKLPNVQVYKAQGSDEPEKGFDWEWWIGRAGRYWRFSIQAKLLKLPSRRYKTLRHFVDGRQQIDILEDFSVTQNTIPLYCFYNSVSEADAEAGWHCALLRDNPQLGCTLVPLDAVKPYTSAWSRRDFVKLHSDVRAIPWRCLVTCPPIIANPTDRLGPPGRDVTPFDHLPGFLAQRDEEDFGRVITVDLPQELYRSELGGQPNKIAVITVDSQPSLESHPSMVIKPPR